MTSLQLLLLLLSVLRRMEAFRYPIYDQGRTGNCHEQDVISKWLSEQVVRNAKMTRFNQRLKDTLDALGRNTTNSIEDGNCCFYEKSTMEKLFADITTLSKKFGIGAETALQKTGDMGQDLDLILDRFKKLVTKDMKSCCDSLADNLKELEADFKKQLENFKLTSNGKSETDKKLNQLKEHVEKLEEKQQGNEKESQNKKCCQEIDLKLNELKTQLESEKTTNLKKELKDFQNKQKEQESKVKDLTEELQQRAKDTQNVMESCEKNCKNEQNKNKSSESITNIAGNDLKRLDNLEQSIKYLIENHKELANMSETLEQCRMFEENLAKTEEKLNEMEEENTCLNEEELKRQFRKTEECCKNIANLQNRQRDLYGKLKQMNASDNDYVSKLNAHIIKLQDQLKQQNAENKENKNIEMLPNAKIDEINKRLDQIDKTLSGNDKKLNELQNKSEKNFDNLKQQVADQQKATDQFKKQTEQRYDELINRNGEKERLDSLERQENQLSEDIEKALRLQNRVDDLEKQVKDALDNLHSMQSNVGQCTTKCKYLDNIDNVINRIKNLEEAGNKKLEKKEVS